MTNTTTTSFNTSKKASDQAGPAVASAPSFGAITPVTTPAAWKELNNSLRRTPPSANGISGCTIAPQSSSKSRCAQDIETVLDLLEANVPKRKRSITHFEGISLAFLEAEKKKADAEKAKNARPIIVRKRAVGLGKLLKGMSIAPSGTQSDSSPGLTPTHSTDGSSDEEDSDEAGDDDDDLLVVISDEPSKL